MSGKDLRIRCTGCMQLAASSGAAGRLAVGSCTAGRRAACSEEQPSSEWLPDKQRRRRLWFHSQGVSSGLFVAVRNRKAIGVEVPVLCLSSRSSHHRPQGGHHSAP
eukprot:92606-Chlamydomonas_euryale.AAC.2